MTFSSVQYILISSIKMHALPGKLLGFISLLLCCLSLRPDALDLTPPEGRMSALPDRTLWVWERRENLASLDPRTTAIATLEETILLGRGISVVPRHQPVIYPENIRRILVIRVEAPGDIAPGLERFAAGAIIRDATADPSIAALQIDFDARRSQRAFYSRLLHDVRRSLPPGLPLSITALASWCSSDDWIGGLPVDEAVPMFFRMEPDRRFASPLPQFEVREPLCRGSIGISTREPFSGSTAGKRLYIFPDRGWQQDLALISENTNAQRTEP